MAVDFGHDPGVLLVLSELLFDVDFLELNGAKQKSNKNNKIMYNEVKIKQLCQYTKIIKLKKYIKKKNQSQLYMMWLLKQF